jgi:hypothetical protein
MKTPDREAIKPRVSPKNLGLLFAILAVFVFVRSQVSHEIYIRWGGLVLTLIVVFGILILKSQRFHRIRSFWVLITIFVTLNLAIFGTILVHASEWELPWFGIILIEIPIFIMFRDNLLSE